MRWAWVVLLTCAVQAGEPLGVRVGKAIDRGVVFLKKQQLRDGSWGRMFDPDHENYEGTRDAYTYPTATTTLSLLTLLKCGVAPDDPRIELGFEFLRKWRNGVSDCAYEISCLMLALEARANPYKRERKREADLRKARARTDKVKLSRADHKWMKALLKALENRENDGGWRYGGTIPHPHGVKRDISSTQFAMMALHAAKRCGVKPSKRMVKRALRYCLDVQEDTGGWASAHDSPTKHETLASGTMTTGGIVILLIARDLLGKLSKKDEARFAEAMQRGMKWIEMHWTVEKNPGYGAYYHLMYLYGLERVGDLQRISLIGGKDWYREGAEWLVKNQRKDGSWTGDSHPPPEILNTCFALLFLDRATISTVTVSEK